MWPSESCVATATNGYGVTVSPQTAAPLVDGVALFPGLTLSSVSARQLGITFTVSCSGIVRSIAVTPGMFRLVSNATQFTLDVDRQTGLGAVANAATRLGAVIPLVVRLLDAAGNVVQSSDLVAFVTCRVCHVGNTTAVFANRFRDLLESDNIFDIAETSGP